MMTIEKLANDSNVSVNQIKRRWREIAGIRKIDDVLIIPDGTRYPMRKPKYIDTHAEKLYALLRAIDTYRYVDDIMLKISKSSFDILIRELLELKWIQDNGCNNQYGANRYDTTISGTIIAKLKKKAAVKEIINTISGAAGHFVGGMTSEFVG